MPFEDDPCEDGADPDRARGAGARPAAAAGGARRAAIDGCLAPDPARRPPVSDLWAALGGRG